MILTYKYRLFPTPAQRTALQRTLDICWRLYNETLHVRKQAWQERGESLSLYETNKLLTQWKQEQPWLAEVYSQVLQEAQERVDLAFKHFFRRVRAGETPGYPRFKGMGWYKSFTFKQPGFGYKLLDNGRLRLSKIGEVKIKLHHPLVGEVKRLTIKRDTLGNWYACFAVEVEPEPLEPSPWSVGIDLGLTHFATLSTGEQVENPRFFRRDEQALAKAQRKLSATERGTPEYRERKRVVQHTRSDQRITNRRKDFAHKLSRSLVDTFQLIAFEDLNPSEMVKLRSLAIPQGYALARASAMRRGTNCAQRAPGTRATKLRRLVERSCCAQRAPPTLHLARLLWLWRADQERPLGSGTRLSSLRSRDRP